LRIADCGLWVNSGLIREIRGKSGVNPFPKQLKQTGHEFNPQSEIRNRVAGVLPLDLHSLRVKSQWQMTNDQ